MIDAPSASTPSIRHESTLTSSTRTVHAPHSPTRQHSFVPVSPRSSRRTSSSVWCGRDVDRAGAPVDGELDAAGSVMRQPLDGRCEPRAGPAPEASPGGSRGLPASTVGDGAASANSAASRRVLPSSGAAGSARTPVSSTTSSGRGPRLPYASRVTPSGVDRARQRDRGEVVAASASPPDVDRPARRRRRAAARSPRRARPAASVVTPERTKNSSSGMTRRPSGPPRRHARRRRAGRAPCRPPATRCRCCRPASPGSGSGPLPTTAAASASAA